MRFLEPGRDLAAAMPGDYDPVLVAVSVFAAVMAAYAAITLADRLRTAGSHVPRAGWLVAGAIAMGAGVWTMHFIGMLAFRLPVEVHYEAWTTLASMLPAIFAAGVTLYIIVGHRATPRRILVGGVLMGAGIGLMHYSGMAAMRLADAMRYDPYLVTLSILVAIVLAAVALHVRFAVPASSDHRLVQDWARVIAAIIMGLAISGMHYTAMLAVYFFPSGGAPFAAGEWVIESGYLGTVVGLTAAAIIGLLIVAIHESELSRRRETERHIRRLNEELERRVAERTGALEEANESLRVHGEDLEAVNDFSSVLQSSATLDDACDAVRVFVSRLFPESGGAIYLARGSDQYLERIQAWGEQHSSERIVDRAECWGLRRSQLHLVADANEGLVCPHIRDRRMGAHACAPLIAQGQVLGLLYLEHGQRFERSRLERVIKTLSEHISLALVNIRMRESLYMQSVRDPLTGLFNRRYLTETLARELAHAARLDKPLAVAMLDVDHFKPFNDEYGHEAGDTVLREVADCLQGNVRASDLAARHGGEEFVLVLLETGRENATAVTEKIRRAIARLELHHEGVHLGSTTVSAGVAVFPDDGDTPEDLLQAADRNLYEAKSRGRDRVVDRTSAT